MRPVNLLPSEHRSRIPSGDGRSAYIALGVLGTILLMLVGWVLAGNSVNSKKGEIADVNAEISQAKHQAGVQSAFGDFHNIAETRVNSVSQLANDRFDWERLVREVSLVLPAGTSLTELDASKTGQPLTSGSGSSSSDSGSSSSSPGSSSSSSASSSSSSSSSSGSSSSGAALPSVHLLGCAAKQRNVATLLVRLRQMHNVDDVQLAESAEQTQSGSDSGASAPGGSSAAGGDGCDPKTFQFDVTVTFNTASSPTGQKRVPARLGGGS